MAINPVNIGSSPNDGTGDPARTAFQKINANETYLLSLINAVGGGTAAFRQVNFGAGAITITAGTNTTGPEMATHINTVGFRVFQGELIVIQLLVKRTVGGQTYWNRQKYLFTRNNLVGTWGTTDPETPGVTHRGTIVYTDIILISDERYLGVGGSPDDKYIDLGDIADATIQAYINAFVGNFPFVNDTLFPDDGSTYFFQVVQNGENKTYKYVGVLPVTLGSAGATTVAGDYDLIASSGGETQIPQVQTDWNEEDELSPAFLLNKPGVSETGDSIFFLEDEADPDIAGYKVMDNPAQLVAVAYVVENTIVDQEIIQEWITDVGSPNTTFIPDGVWIFRINAFKTGGSKEVRLYNEIYKRNSGGTETLLGTTANSIALSDVEVALPRFNLYIAGQALLATDRIVVKTRMRLIGGGANPTSVTVGYSGTTGARLSIPAQVVSNVPGPGSSIPVSKTGTSIVFTEDAFYNQLAFLTTGNLTLDLTGAVSGATCWVYCDRYIPIISGNYLLSGNILADKLNILMCTYDNNIVQITSVNKTYLATPVFTIELGSESLFLSGYTVPNSDSYSIKFNTVNNEAGAIDVPDYNGTDATYTHNGLTNGTTYYYFIKASGQGFLQSNTGTQSATPEAGLVFNVQAPDSSFTLPLVSTGVYDFDLFVDDIFIANITTWNQAETIIALGDTLTHKIECRGTIQGWTFSANAQKNKIYDLENWGGLRFSGSVTISRWFDGCNNLTISAIDSPDFTNSTSGFYAFRSCTSLTTIPSAGTWDLSSFTTLNGMFIGCSLFNMDLNGLITSALCTNYSQTFQSCTLLATNLFGLNMTGATNVSSMFAGARAFNGNLNWAQLTNCTNFGAMFNDADAFNQDISAIDFTPTNGTIGSFLLNTPNVFSVANYDLFLVAFEAQVAAAGGAMNGGNFRLDANYTTAGAGGTARASLVGTYGYTITDLGGI